MDAFVVTVSIIVLSTDNVCNIGRATAPYLRPRDYSSSGVGPLHNLRIFDKFNVS